MSSVDSHTPPKTSNVDDNAIYFEVSPKIVLVIRIYNIIMLLMVVLAFVICLVKGHENKANYLLACNLVLSSLVGTVINWWYRKNELSSDKYWYIFLLATVIIFQAITTDVYVFHQIASPVPPAPTVLSSSVSPASLTTSNMSMITTHTI